MGFKRPEVQIFSPRPRRNTAQSCVLCLSGEKTVLLRNARVRLQGSRHATPTPSFRVAAAVRMPVSTHIHRLTLALALPSPGSLQIFSPGPRRRGLCSSAAIFYHRSLAPSAPPLPRKITFLQFCSDLPGSFRRRHYRFCAVSPAAFLSGNILCLYGDFVN